jgi:O-antigen ligase
MLFGLCFIVMISAVLLGGGTHSGFLGDVAIQLLSVPLLTMAIWPAFSAQNPSRRAARLSLYLICIVSCLVLAETLSLPFDYWTGAGAVPFQGKGEFPGPHTLSLTPQATWAAAASIIVPISVFAATALLDGRQRMYISWLLLGLGALSLLLGFLQFAQGPGSALRFYDFTNQEDAVGLFANRNHFAAYLYITLILSAVWFAAAAEASLHNRIFKARSLFWFAAAGAFLIAIVAGLAMARSRAGLILAIAALAGMLIMTVRQGRLRKAREARSHLGRASFAIVLFAVLFAAQFGLGTILTRFEQGPAEDLRMPLAQTTAAAALRAMPSGTGLGSFVNVYAAVEKESDVFPGFANRAHNDLLELLLETGLPGAGLLLAFLIWFSRRSYAVWAAPAESAGSYETYIERAATLAIALLFLHSLVDYPLRTAALAAVFAFFSAILAFPAGRTALREAESSRGPRRVLRARPEKWGSKVDWPDSWQHQGNS